LKLCFIFSFIILFNSCKSDSIDSHKKNGVNLSDSTTLKQIKSIIQSDSFAVFLEYDSVGAANEYGKIMLFDFNKRKKVKLVDNLYFNANPIWMIGGNKILFASAREGDLNRLKVQSKHSKKQLYLYDINNMKIEQFFANNSSDFTDISNFVGLCENNDENVYYFSDGESNIYSLSKEDKSLKILKQFNSGAMINGLYISKNNKYLAIDYWHLGDEKYRIYIYDIKNNKIVSQIEDNEPLFCFNWADDNIFYFSRSLEIFEYNLIKRTWGKINILNDRKFIVQEIISTDINNMLLLVKIRYINQEYLKATEIVKYNKRTRNLEWLTNDGENKSNLSVLIK